MLYINKQNVRPKKNIRMVQKKIREWVSKLDDISNDKQYNQIFEKMNP
jgi:hypothetical protein